MLIPIKARKADLQLKESYKMDIRKDLNLTPVVTGVVVAIGITLCGYLIGRSMERFKSYDRTVVVKGIAEKEVMADLAVWNISFSVTGPMIDSLEKQMEHQRKLVNAFLRAQGFQADHIKFESTSVTDKWASHYGSSAEKIKNRYVFEQAVKVRTSDVELVVQANSQIGKLLKEGVLVSSYPHFYYTKFLELRPVLIGEATKNAREAASQFAIDSGAKVGGIRSANQGLVQINGGDAYGEDQDYSEQRSVKKKIRVVSTITFSLES